MTDRTTYVGGQVFDGEELTEGLALTFEAGQLTALSAEREAQTPAIDLGGDIVMPGFVDLQVNGGDGLMFSDDPSPATLARIAGAHRRLAATQILPTLITDTPEKTAAAIEATCDAIAAQIPGIAGLHLEGPHLSRARKGAHDEKLIRPMEAGDLARLLAAKTRLPILKVTVAAESVTTKQVQTLSEAGILVSLGHTDASFETVMAYAKAGARCVTHLFNAMSQLGNRDPGVVGAALANGQLSAGLIADGIHVHPETMRAAWRSKTGPGSIFLVSDAMAVAGTDLSEFLLEGRRIRRSDHRLTLDDGTLAGADLDLLTAVRVMVRDVGVPLEDALAAASKVPADLVGLSYGLVAGETHQDDLIRLKPDLSVASPL